MRLTVSLSLSLLVLCAAQTENVALPAVLPKKTGGKGGGKSGGKGVIGKVFGGLDSLKSSKSGKIKGSGAISSANLLAVGKMRERLLNFYCPTHQTLFPCTNHEFTKKLKAASDASFKKAVFEERQATMAAMGPEERKRKMADSRHAFQDMYSAYCKRGASAEIAGYNAEICTDPTMKQLYAPKLSKLFGA